MKKLLASALLLGVFGLSAQTITVKNESRTPLTNIFFGLRDGREQVGSFYGHKTIQVPQGAVKFKVVSIGTYRNAVTREICESIETQWIPLLTSNDQKFRVTLDRSDASNLELCIEEID